MSIHKNIQFPASSSINSQHAHVWFIALKALKALDDNMIDNSNI